MRREKYLRNGVHHANAVVWGPVYRTRLNLRGVGRGRAVALFADRDGAQRRVASEDGDVVLARRRAEVYREGQDLEDGEDERGVEAALWGGSGAGGKGGKG